MNKEPGEPHTIYYVRKKLGTGRGGGADRDQGYIYHAVADSGEPSWERALCGTKPGLSGNGWGVCENSQITCAKCNRMK